MSPVPDRPWFSRPVGIAGIALLAGFLLVLLFGPTGEPSWAVRKTACISNLRLLARGITEYSDDNDGRAPLRDSWMDGVEPYCLLPEIEHCPEVRGDGLFGYAFNASVKAMRSQHEKTTPLIYDSLNLGKNASDPFASLPKPGRHQGRDNVAYVDGHAKSVDPNARKEP